MKAICAKSGGLFLCELEIVHFLFYEQTKLELKKTCQNEVKVHCINTFKA